MATRYCCPSCYSENISGGDRPDTCKCNDCGHEFHERDIYEVDDGK
jgi:predicted Zn-ribbon and HTH transcriptional regulator